MPPAGFKAAAVAAGLRYTGRPDLGLIVADPFQASAGAFTTSVCRAAPVSWSKLRAAHGRAILVNAGQANAMTGAAGHDDCRTTASRLATLLGVGTDQVLLASTGIIGQRLKVETLTRALPQLVSRLSVNGFDEFSRAILTTDTVPKTVTVPIPYRTGPACSIWGAAKGSGMIAPNMATLLGFLLSDASIEPNLLSRIVRRTADATFNRITIDGDTSTNDAVIVVCSGAAGRTPAIGGADADLFERSLLDAMGRLAKALVVDAEGATRLVEISVISAKDPDQARKAAKTVAESPLVKTAFFGRDANWGRIMAALGRSGAAFDPDQVDLRLDNVLWVRGGRDTGSEAAATEVMKNRREYKLEINLRAGESNYSVLTCDLSPRYVEINGSYRS